MNANDLLYILLGLFIGATVLVAIYWWRVTKATSQDPQTGGDSAMTLYFISTSSLKDDKPEVHRQDCIFNTLPHNRVILGIFETSSEAMQFASRFYENVDGCRECVPEFNTG